MFLVSCASEYTKVLNGNDSQKKYKKAKELYVEGDYEKANPLFDQLYYVYRGTDKAESLDYIRAQSYYNLGLGLVAAEYFKNYAKDYPNSDKVCEALFLVLSSYYDYSESSQRDQTYTLASISAIQNFVDRCPTSDTVSKVNRMASMLRGKLAKKAYDRAFLYYENRQYRSAVHALGNYINDYPESSNVAIAAFFRLKSGYEYALGSVVEKQKKRFIEAGTAYREYVRVSSTTVSGRGISDHDKMSVASEIYGDIVQKLNTLE